MFMPRSSPAPARRAPVAGPPCCARFLPCSAGSSCLVAGEVVAFDLSIPAQVFGRERGALRLRRLRAGAPARWRPRPASRSSRAHGLEALEARRHGDRARVSATAPGRSRPRSLDALRAAAAAGRADRVSICTGAFVLAAAGLLDGRRATTHWRHAERLARAFPGSTSTPTCSTSTTGDVLTSAGVAAGIDLCLHLVRRDHGADGGQRGRAPDVVAPHRDGGQAQFVERPLPGAERRRPRPPRARGCSSASTSR